MQTAYNLNTAKGIHGQKADSRFDLVESMQAVAAIPMGRGVIKQYGSDVQCRLPRGNKVTITDDTGTWTATDLTINVNGKDYTYTYGVSKDASMAAIAAAIQADVAVNGVYSCAYVAGSHTITLLSRNVDLVVTVDVAALTGTMTISSIVATTTDSILGFALNKGFADQGLPGGTGTVEYAATEAVNVIRKGAMYVLPEETVTSDDAVYLRVVANGAKLPGMFGKSADSSKCVLLTGVRWVEGGTTTTVAKLEINLP